MGLKKRKSIGIVDFIHPLDGAINTDINKDTGKKFSDVDEYKSTWDFESHCVLRKDVQPTVFKLNFEVDHKSFVAMKNASLGGFGKDQEAGFQVGSHAAQVVKTILVGIDNPTDFSEDEKIIFEKHNNLFVADKVMVELEKLGVVDDIYAFYMTNKDDPEKLKKS